MLPYESEFCEPPPDELILAGNRFELVRDSRWNATYKNEDDGSTLVLSKLLYGTFDWSYLDLNCPESLSDEELYPTAAAIYVASDREEIPLKWKEFASRHCGPGWDKNIPERLLHLFEFPDEARSSGEDQGLLRILE